MRAVAASRSRASRLVGAGLAALIALLAVALAATRASSAPNTYTVQPLVSDGGVPAAVHDANLVNPFGLAASPSGPWWTANEARSSSTLYAADGRKQNLTVAVRGGPTGIVYNPTSGFQVAAGGVRAPARFIYAGEDGVIRGWAPTVPRGWSDEAEVAVDHAGVAAVFRGVALSAPPRQPARLYATDFHNDRVEVFDAGWRPIVRRGAFADSGIPAWYAPYNILVDRDRVFVTFASRAPPDGNDGPTGGFVDEFDLAGRLLGRVAARGVLNGPWGLAVAPKGFGRFSGDLLVGNFGDGRINAFHESSGHRWRYAGTLADQHGKPIVINGLWGLAFGNGGMAGPADTLFFAAGPHQWTGATEMNIHGLIGAIHPAG